MNRWLYRSVVPPPSFTPFTFTRRHLIGHQTVWPVVCWQPHLSSWPQSNRYVLACFTAGTLLPGSLSLLFLGPRAAGFAAVSLWLTGILSSPLIVRALAGFGLRIRVQTDTELLQECPPPAIRESGT